MVDGVGRPQFDVDLGFGETRETAFVKALTDCHVECKSDQKARATGRVFIEFRQGSAVKGEGRPSGIAVTTASWFAIEVFHDRWIVIRTSILRDICRQVQRQHGSIMGGDDKRFEGVLVPVSWLTQPMRSQPDPTSPGT